MEELDKRKENILSYFKTNKNWIIYLILIFIVLFGYSVRTNNLGLLNDVVTGDYIPLALDPYSFLRYAEQIVETGEVVAHDTKRYFPLGYDTSAENIFVSYFIAYMFKFLNFFNSSFTLNYVDVIYPPIVFSIGLIFFFLLLRKIFDYRVALLASFLLTVIPTFLYRTMAGFSDKEALATMFMFIALYFFTVAWRSSKLKNAVILGLVSGIATGLMALSWGGVQFIFLTIGIFQLVILLLGKSDVKKFLVYSSWMFPMFLIAINFSGRYTLNSVLSSFTTGIVILSFIASLVKYLIYDLKILNLKSKLEGYPNGLVSIIFALLIASIFATLLYGPSFIPSTLKDQYIDLIEPFGRTRWALTVAESHQPYIRDWVNNLGFKYIWLFIFGSIILFYEVVKVLNKHKWKLTTLYSLFIIAFIFSRYSPESSFNGVTSISKIAYLGSLFGFILILGLMYLYAYYKDKGLFEKFREIDEILIFMILWFILMIIAARSAIRLLFIFSPVTTIMVSYLVFWLVDKAKRLNNLYRISTYLIIAIIILAPFSISSSFAFGLLDTGIVPRFFQSTISTSKNIGPSYNGQWQRAMDWVRKSTPEDAIFAHWWDYGYWVQYGGQRTTLSDGGNAIGAINHFVGRHVLTAQSEEEALEFLKSRGANYLLMISDEVGKYSAFSSIGADANYDRYSWIPTLSLDPNIQEGREGVNYVYRGGSVLDDSFEFQGRVFRGGSAGIGAVILPGKENGESISFSQPVALIVDSGQQFSVPLKCLYFDNRLIEFPGEGLDGCLRIIPSFISNEQVNRLGAALYLSPDVKKSLFSQLYLFDKQTDNFELVYNDEHNLPLSLFQGRIIGPLKIWKVNASEDIEINPIYQGSKLPDPKVQQVRR